MLQYEENKPVLRYFFVTAAAVALLPLVTFAAVQFGVRKFFGLEGSVIATASSLGILLVVVASYAIHAYYEEKRDYFASNPHDSRPVWTVDSRADTVPQPTHMKKRQ